MSSELAYRLAVVAVLLATTSVVAYYRIQAAVSRETVSRREEGWPMLIGLRFSGVALFAATLAYVLAPSTMAWASVEAPSEWRWLGGGLGGAGSCLMAWTLHSLGKNLTDTVAVRQAACLVTHGPYGWVRHPFYVAAGLTMVGVTLLASNAAIGGLCIAVWLLLALRTPKEEQRLVDRFGDAYRRYQQTTGMFFPKWR